MSIKCKACGQRIVRRKAIQRKDVSNTYASELAEKIAYRKNRFRVAKALKLSEKEKDRALVRTLFKKAE